MAGLGTDAVWRRARGSIIAAARRARPLWGGPYDLVARIWIETAPSAYLGIDDAGRVTECNAAAERVLGRRRSAVIGRAVAELGDLIPGSVAPGTDAPAKVEERFERAFEEAPVGISLTSLDGVFLRVNRALAELLGRTAAELEGTRVTDVTHPDDQPADEAARRGLIAGTSDGHRTEKRYVRRDGHSVLASLSTSVIRAPDGRPSHFVSHMEDITDRREAEEQLVYRADHDGLTGLMNRRRFEAELDAALARSQRYGHPVALLVIDLDNFKQINDTLGHAAGDEALARTAELLRARLRRTDVLARLGGDEFAAVLPETGYEKVKTVAADLLSVIRTISVGAAPAQLTLSASAGIALLSAPREIDGDGMLQHADTAMYEAKKAGRGTYRLLAHGISGGGGDTASQVELIDVLRAVEEFGSASAELIAWEFMLDPEQLEPVWSVAVEQELVRESGHDPHTGETAYELSERGTARTAAVRDGAPEPEPEPEPETAPAPAAGTAAESIKHE